MKKLLLILALCTVALSVQAQQNNPRFGRLSVTGLQVLPGIAPTVVEISGIATNLTDARIKKAIIHFNLYSTEGVLVGNTITDANNIDPRGSWRFSVTTRAGFSYTEISQVNIYDN